MYRTGFCQIGCHEGTRPKSASGKPMKVCVGFAECTCDCHSKITKMYEMTGLERVPQDNPEYIPAPNVDLTWLEDMRTAEGVEAVPMLEESLVEEKAMDFSRPAPTTLASQPNGYRQRGQLEDQVLDVCKRAMLGEFAVQMTPKNIALTINPVVPPSVGAIGAVLDRWKAYGFAKIERSPVRFMMFTADGMMKGLPKMRDDYKRARARQG